jgi:hypothetical protein
MNPGYQFTIDSSGLGECKGQTPCLTRRAGRSVCVEGR